jgi:hypothetical protein
MVEIDVLLEKSVPVDQSGQLTNGAQQRYGDGQQPVSRHKRPYLIIGVELLQHEFKGSLKCWNYSLSGPMITSVVSVLQDQWYLITAPGNTSWQCLRAVLDGSA